ncbi:hypothetical protein [Rhodospirillaceae bacterium SYSU D60014]|uniref:hypothetical protein n=1 Tax=Virgifigura deserti TaxID=2268457 RepID=UPI000E6685C6
MDEQEFEAALSLLVGQMENEDVDSHEIFMRLTAILNGMKALGMPLPADLVAMQAEMAEEFAVPDEGEGSGTVA